MANWTHQITAKMDEDFYRGQYNEAAKDLYAKVVNGYWTQDQADRGLAWYAEALAEAEAGTVVIASQHKSATAAAKGLEAAKADPRYRDETLQAL